MRSYVLKGGRAVFLKRADPGTRNPNQARFLRLPDDESTLMTDFDAINEYTIPRQHFIS